VKIFLKSANISKSYERISYLFYGPRCSYYSFDLVIYALDSVIYALNLKHALDLFIYALDLLIYALHLVKYALEARLSHFCPRSSQSCPSSSRFAGSRGSLIPTAGTLNWTDLAVYCWNDASWPRMCLLGYWWQPTILRDSIPLPKKKAWLGIFQPNWQNHKIARSLTANIGSTPNFHRTTKQHSQLRGWSRMTKFQFKMADGRHIGKYWKYCYSLTDGPIWMKLG